MPSQHQLSLSQALGTLEAEVWRDSGFSAVGLVSEAKGGRRQLDLRTPNAVSVNLVDAAALPPALQLPTAYAVPVRIATESTLLFATIDGEPAFPDSKKQLVHDLAHRLEDVITKGEDEAAYNNRLARIDTLAQVLPLLGSALDVREIFQRLSEIAARVIPHDSLNVDLDASSLDDGCLYVIHRDFDGAFRSSIRAAVWLDGKVSGVLDISSLEPNRFNDEDAAVVLQLAEYVTLALSHERLATAARIAEAQRERAANLEMLDRLLEALSGALDIRDVFHRVSEISRTVLAHDAMAIAITLDNPPRLRIHALSGLGDMPSQFEAPMPEPFLLKDPWDYRLSNFSDNPAYSQSPTVKAGMRSVLCIPVRIDGRLHAGINFYSRKTDHFTLDDVVVARRITDHIALAFSHQKLAQDARETAELRVATENLEMLDDLLAATSPEGELDDVLERVTAIAQKVLPHDAMLLSSALLSSALLSSALLSSALLSSWQPGGEFDLIDNLPQHPARPYLDADARGYQSALRVPVRVESRDAGSLVLLSLAPASFKQADVLSAHRIADRLALALAREQREEISERAAEATARAAALEARVQELTEELDARTGARHVLGDSPVWKEVLGQATRVAATDATVLLRGESGTGKEIVARFVHRASPHRHGPFVALNCAALPEHLLEAELFGYERGAFTDAAQSKAGLLEQAAGGTLFLDEVGELTAPAQAKFLRVLQEREFQRLGGTRVLRSDARIIAATNRDLEQLISLGRFREDLYYRLNVFAIHLPLLRDRRDDIRPLTDALLAGIVRGIGRPHGGISEEARAMLWAYDWPGNVRELRNVLERAAILCEGGPITPEHLSLNTEPQAAAAIAAPAAPAATQQGEATLGADEKAQIEKALADARFNKSKAAKALGLTRAQLYVRMHRHGLD